MNEILRRKLREYKTYGDPCTHAQLICAGIRAGKIRPSRVKLAAFLKHPGAAYYGQTQHWGKPIGVVINDKLFHNVEINDIITGVFIFPKEVAHIGALGLMEQLANVAIVNKFNGRLALDLCKRKILYGEEVNVELREVLTKIASAYPRVNQRGTTPTNHARTFLDVGLDILSLEIISGRRPTPHRFKQITLSLSDEGFLNGLRHHLIPWALGEFA